MSEILIYSDYNGGFVVRDHYVDYPATGRIFEKAMENWFRRNRYYVTDHKTGIVNLGNLRFIVMDCIPSHLTTEDVRSRMPEWVDMVENIKSQNSWIKRRVCPCCGQMVDV